MQVVVVDVSVLASLERILWVVVELLAEREVDVLA